MTEIFKPEELFPTEHKRLQRKTVTMPMDYKKEKKGMVTTIEPTKQSAVCPVCGKGFKTVKRQILGNDSPSKEKRKIYHLLPLCEKCAELHPNGHEKQKVFRYNQNVGA